MKKIFWAIIPLFFISCNGNKENSVSKDNSLEYTYDDGNIQLKLRIDEVPKRAVLFTPYVTEMLLALGQGDKIVLGTMEGEVLPEFKQSFEKIPHKSNGHHFNITKEAFLLLEPDFVSGFPADINAETTGTPEELLSNGIKPFLLETFGKQDATLEDVYADFRLLAKIFKVEHKAEEIITNQKEKLKQAHLLQSNPDEEKVKVLVMYNDIPQGDNASESVKASMGSGVWVYGSLVTDLINRANGQNIYADVPTQYELVSYESVLHRNPDVIFMVDIASKGVKIEDKMNYFKTNPILKNINAARNNRIYKVDLEEIYPGVRNVDFIIKMNKILYGK